ncbi:hypothetical protein UlMin_009654 [Ulmus minor]
MDGKGKIGAPFIDGVIDTWLSKHRLLYVGATRHPLILSIRDGTVNISAFKIWLGQDYLFVRAFAAFVGSVLVKAWKQSDDGSDMEVILGGMAALNDEIAWFKKEASKWGIDLSNIVPRKPTDVYIKFLESLMSPDVEYTVVMTAFWAIEAVYQESFAHCLEDGAKTPPELQETCQRWGNQGFGEYCSCLKNIANRRLEMASVDLFKQASNEVVKKAEVALLSVLEHEIDFWNMSRSDS